MNKKNSISNILFHPKYTHSFFKLQLSSEKILVKEYIQMVEEELTNSELVDMALEVVEASPSNLDFEC
jgi:hypothetical protein